MLKKILNLLKKARGYTLVEVAAVVAVTGMLSAVVMTAAKYTYERSKLNAASEDIEKIYGAIQAFYNDTGDYPVRFSRDVYDYYEFLYSGNTLKTKSYGGMPTIIAGGLSDRLFNHIMQNNPENVNWGAYTGWKGSYLARNFDKYDPWGNSYIIYTRPLWREKTYTGKDEEVAWILSGGPNEMIETWPTDIELQGDDIGMVISYGPLARWRLPRRAGTPPLPGVLPR